MRYNTLLETQGKITGYVAVIYQEATRSRREQLYI
jgi:hypothetical protein